jgi:hypothetical protein
MTDKRLCTICGLLVDITHPDVTVLSGGGGHGRRTTVRDETTGLVHVVTTKRLTEKKLAGATALSPYMEEK